jgi:hypothetical protein
MVVRKKKIVIDGQEVEVPVFDTKIIPGKEIDTDTLDQLSKEEEIEKKLQDAIEKIRIVKTKYENVSKNIDYFYSVGKILQFVDKEDYFKKQKGKIWQRMARDIAPDLFLFDDKKKIQESKRYPEFMYLLAKIPKQLLGKASWDQWYEIMKFRGIYKKQGLLIQILRECKSVGAGPSLRNKIKLLLDRKDNKK